MSQTSPPKPRTYKTGRRASAPWTKLIYEILLAEGETAKERLVQEGMRLVPPERAIARREMNRRALGKRKKPDAPERPVSLERAIRIGARAVVTQSLMMLVRGGSLVQVERNGEIFIKVAPNRVTAKPPRPPKRPPAEMKVVWEEPGAIVPGPRGGAAPRAEWTKAVITLLAREGEVPREQALAEGIKLVPPGRALREREKRRAHSNNNRPEIVDRREKQVSTEYKVRVGARVIVTQSLDVLLKRGSIERVERDGIVYYRLGKKGRA